MASLQLNWGSKVWDHKWFCLAFFIIEMYFVITNYISSIIVEVNKKLTKLVFWFVSFSQQLLSCMTTCINPHNHFLQHDLRMFQRVPCASMYAKKKKCRIFTMTYLHHNFSESIRVSNQSLISHSALRVALAPWRIRYLNGGILRRTDWTKRICACTSK